MPVVASSLNKRVQFHRRSAVPSAPLTLRGGFVEIGGPVWAAYKDGPQRSMTVGGWDLEAKSGTITVRSSAFTQGIDSAHQIEMDGRYFEIVNVLVPTRNDGTLAFAVVSAPDRDAYAQVFEAKG